MSVVAGCTAVKVIFFPLLLFFVVTFKLWQRLCGRGFFLPGGILGLWFNNSFPTINSRTLIPLFRPGSVHSGSASWDGCATVFPDNLCIPGADNRHYFVWKFSRPHKPIFTHSINEGERTSSSTYPCSQQASGCRGPLPRPPSGSAWSACPRRSAPPLKNQLPVNKEHHWASAGSTSTCHRQKHNTPPTVHVAVCGPSSHERITGEGSNHQSSFVCFSFLFF